MKSASVLDDKQLKQIYGGSGSGEAEGTLYRYRCDENGTIGPHKNPWYDRYKKTEDIADAIKAICFKGGDCKAVVINIL